MQRCLKWKSWCWWKLIPPTTTPPSPRAPPAGLLASSPAPWSRSLSSGVPPSWSQTGHKNACLSANWQTKSQILVAKLKKIGVKTVAPARELKVSRVTCKIGGGCWHHPAHSPPHLRYCILSTLTPLSLIKNGSFTQKFNGHLQHNK